jgi:hypothetical protein
MTTFDDLAQRYIDTWNETDPSARRAAVDQLYTEDARYIDPLAVAGREGDRVDDRRCSNSSRTSGSMASPVDRYRPARFGWGLGPAGSPADREFDVRMAYTRPHSDGAGIPRQGSRRGLSVRPDVRRTH